ncbi:hypothetical protein CspeluHIS016_0103450 [Cutaneotrichosporon spelunceum]|uniref:Calcineurin-like phosphoesterase domain-containing protein n=1 Tax=Cutaneotrichosporon spelunceum TaxID=1672016 RepID=A0AAD3TNH3_9TREE|nr:hypothetical protein CspeluHIS016_0103450 [Cutaneotrichosporon spelunceum]
MTRVALALALVGAVHSYILPLEDLRPAPRLPLPTRPLEWGDVNFLSTSDTHGWLLGHQHNTWPEPNYSGDFGSFASFASHMRAKAEDQGVDLLLVDAGDHHDGSGLVSSSPEGAGLTDDIFGMLDYDVLTLGNHELYKYEAAKWIYDRRDRWNGRFLTSNTNITVEEDGKVVSVPIGDRFAKFETQQGRKVTAFGVLFKFKAHDRNLTVQSPTKMAREAWFIDAIRDAPDYFVLAGHMPVRGFTSEWLPIYEAIRDRHPLVPIFIFGGHTHVRDCVQYDGRTIGVVPGRYLETIAFTSSNLPGPDDDGETLRMNRRYLDANDVTYRWHTGTTQRNFDTDLGRNISDALATLADKLKLSRVYGDVPHDYFLLRHPYGHPRSVITVFERDVIPQALQDEKRGAIPRIVIGNAGSLRFDVFKGSFDKNDELTVSPFTSAFFYTRLEAGIGKAIADEMNRAGASKLLPMSPREEDEAHVQQVYNEWLASQWEDYVQNGGEEDLFEAEQGQKPLSRPLPSKPKTLGYVTRDACVGKGDDIEHIPVPFSPNQVDFIRTPLKGVPDDEEIDVVVMDFAMDDFLIAAHLLRPDLKLSWDHFEPYAEGTLINSIFSKYARIAW